jgi:hypothetical protein
VVNNVSEGMMLPSSDLSDVRVKTVRVNRVIDTAVLKRQCRAQNSSASQLSYTDGKEVQSDGDCE